MACTSGIWGAHRPGQTKLVKEVHSRQGREEPQLFDGPQLAGTAFLESGAHRPKHAKPPTQWNHGRTTQHPAGLSDQDRMPPTFDSSAAICEGASLSRAGRKSCNARQASWEAESTESERCCERLTVDVAFSASSRIRYTSTQWPQERSDTCPNMYMLCQCVCVRALKRA